MNENSKITMRTVAQTNAVKTPLLTSALLCATAHKSRIVCEQHWNNIHI